MIINIIVQFSIIFNQPDQILLSCALAAHPQKAQNMLGEKGVLYNLEGGGHRAPPSLQDLCRLRMSRKCAGEENMARLVEDDGEVYNNINNHNNKSSMGLIVFVIY